MTTVSKVLAVLVVTMSLAFFGFVSAMLVGGPNWEKERRSDVLLDEGYTIEATEGEVVTWTAKVAGQSVGGASPVEPKAIVAARKDLKSKQETRIADLKRETEALQTALDALRALIAKDRRAIENRSHTLEYLLEQQAEANLALAEEIEQVSTDGLATQKTLKARRNDVNRLQQQIRELRAETAKIVDHEKLLESRLTILLGEIERLSDRRDQLREQLGSTAVN